MVEGTPPGDAIPPPPQPSTPARRGARCEAGAGSPGPHRPHPGHTDRGNLAARSRGRAAGGGTAPDTRRPSQRWQATPPGDGSPPPPRHAAPTGHAGQGDSVGPPHPLTCADSTWVADPNSPPSARAVGGGTAPDLRCPSQWWKAPPPGTPFHHPHSEQRRPAGAHTVEPVLGPHARMDRTWNTRVVVPMLPAAEDGRPGEGQLLTPDAPRNGGGPPPRGRPPPAPRSAAPTGPASRGDSAGPPEPAHPRPQQEWMTDPDSPPRGRTVGGGGAPDRRRPSQRTRGPRNLGCPPLRNTGNTGHGDRAGPRTRTPVPTARGQRASTAPRRRAAGAGRAPGLGRPLQRGRHGPRGGST